MDVETCVPSSDSFKQTGHSGTDIAVRYINYRPAKNRVLPLNLIACYVTLRRNYFLAASRTLQLQYLISPSEFEQRSEKVKTDFFSLDDEIDLLTFWLTANCCKRWEEFEWLECAEADALRLRMGYGLGNGKFNKEQWRRERITLINFYKKLFERKENCEDCPQDEQIHEVRRLAKFENLIPRLDSYLAEPLKFQKLRLPHGRYSMIWNNLVDESQQLAGVKVLEQQKLDLLCFLNRAGMNLAGICEGIFKLPYSRFANYREYLFPAYGSCICSEQPELVIRRAIIHSLQKERSLFLTNPL